MELSKVWKIARKVFDDLGLEAEIEYKEECVAVQPDEVFNDDDLDVELIEW